MRQIAIKIKKEHRGVNIVNNNNLSKRIFKGLFWSLGVFAACYVFLLGNMVFNIIERKSLELEARNISNDVGELELEYLALSSKIDLDYAHTLGFKEASKKYATRTSLGSLSLVPNEL